MLQSITNFPKKVKCYFKLATFSALQVTAVTFCPPMQNSSITNQIKVCNKVVKEAERTLFKRAQLQNGLTCRLISPIFLHLSQKSLNTVPFCFFFSPKKWKIKAFLSLLRFCNGRRIFVFLKQFRIDHLLFKNRFHYNVTLFVLVLSVSAPYIESIFLHYKILQRNCCLKKRVKIASFVSKLLKL